MKIAKDADSDRANPRRGYHDRTLVVEFEGENEDQREGAKKALLMKLTPMNMWCRVTEFNETHLIINYGFDSGD